MTAPRAWLALVLLLCCPALRAGENVDAQGDPLPKGAVARLGSARGWQPWGECASPAFSPDGKRIACVGRPSTVYLWEAATLKPVGQLKAGGKVRQIDWLPSGKHLVVLLDDGVVECLPVPGGKPDWTLSLGSCRCVAVSPDGKTLAAGRAEGKLELFDLNTRKSMKVFTDHGDDRIDGVVFSPDGKRVASVSYHTVAVRDVASGKRLHLAAYETPLACPVLAFSDDANYLLTSAWIGSPKGTRVLRWKLGEEKPAEVWTSDSVYTKLVDAHGRWHLGRGENKETEVRQAKGNDKPVPLEKGYETVAYWCASPDGETIAGLTEGGHLLLWSSRTGKRLLRQPGHIMPVDCLALSQDGTTVLSSARFSPDVLVWDARKGRVRDTLTMPGLLHCLLLTPDDTRVVASTVEGLHTVDLKRHTLSTLDNGRSSRLSFVPGTERVLYTHRECESVLSDGETVLEMVVGTAHTWDLKGQESVEWPLEKPKTQIVPGEVLLSPDGRWIAYWRAGGQVVIWDARTGRRTLRFVKEETDIRDAVFSPNGRVLAVVTGTEVYLFESATGQRRQTWQCASDALCAAWLPDGRGLVLGHRDGHLTVRDALSGRVAATLDAHGCCVSALAVSGDGKTLASGANDGTVLLWTMPVLKPERHNALTDKQLETAWADLNSDDGPRAARALAALAADPARAVPFLDKQLATTAPPSLDDVKRLFADLDAQRFATRRQASAQLASLGRGIEPALAELRRGTASAEVRARVDGILEEMDLKPSEAAWRQIRAVEALERAGTPEARKLLEALAQQPEWTPLSREARAVLGRQP